MAHGVSPRTQRAALLKSFRSCLTGTDIQIPVKNWGKKEKTSKNKPMLCYRHSRFVCQLHSLGLCLNIFNQSGLVNMSMCV